MGTRQTNQTTIDASDPKDERRQAIITAAFETFSSYGFKRTSMDDIASAAQISRPALYNSFANKADIFRAGVLSMLEERRTISDQAIESGRPLPDLLRQLVEIWVLEPHRMLLAKPHGLEMLGLKNEFAPDEFDQWKIAKTEALVTALTRFGKFDSSQADDVASTMVSVFEGIKSTEQPIEQIEQQINALLRVVTRLPGVDAS